MMQARPYSPSRLVHWLLAATLCLFAVTGQAQTTLTGDHIPTNQGDLIIHPVHHASFVMQWNGKVIYVDPVGGAALYSGLPRPDLILVTHVHSDHFDPDTLNALHASTLIAPQTVANKVPANMQGLITQVMHNGDDTNVGGIHIHAMPMYNLTKERLQYHPKGNGNGYVLTLGGIRVYIAGDTEDIPEMLALKNIDVAFIPMNLPYTMTVQQAAKAVRTFRPRIVYPYHYRGSDTKEFKRLVGNDVGVDVRLRDWY